MNNNNFPYKIKRRLVKKKFIRYSEAWKSGWRNEKDSGRQIEDDRISYTKTRFEFCLYDIITTHGFVVEKNSSDHSVLFVQNTKITLENNDFGIEQKNVDCTATCDTFKKYINRPRIIFTFVNWTIDDDSKTILYHRTTH